MTIINIFATLSTFKIIPYHKFSSSLNHHFLLRSRSKEAVQIDQIKNSNHGGGVWARNGGFDGSIECGDFQRMQTVGRNISTKTIM